MGLLKVFTGEVPQNDVALEVEIGFRLVSDTFVGYPSVDVAEEVTDATTGEFWTVIAVWTVAVGLSPFGVTSVHDTAAINTIHATIKILIRSKLRGISEIDILLLPDKLWIYRWKTPPRIPSRGTIAFRCTKR